jgi:hypothetical protein
MILSGRVSDLYSGMQALLFAMIYYIGDRWR